MSNSLQIYSSCVPKTLYQALAKNQEQLTHGKTVKYNDHHYFVQMKLCELESHKDRALVVLTQSVDEVRFSIFEQGCTQKTKKNKKSTLPGLEQLVDLDSNGAKPKLSKRLNQDLQKLFNIFEGCSTLSPSHSPQAMTPSPAKANYRGEENSPSPQITKRKESPASPPKERVNTKSPLSPQPPPKVVTPSRSKERSEKRKWSKGQVGALAIISALACFILFIALRKGNLSSIFKGPETRPGLPLKA